MSELQDKLDRGEITPQELFDAWDLKMEERERLHPGFHDRFLIFGWPSIRVTARMPTNSFFRNNRIDPLKQRIMYERSNIPVTRSVEKQSWWDVETSGGRGLDSVTLYRGFYVQIDNSPDMDVIWVGINTGYDSVTYVYAEYPKGTPLSYIKTESLIGVDQLIAAHKLTSQDRTPRLG